MLIRVDMGWLVATLLVSARVAAATMLVPVLGPTQIPAPARALLTLALSALIVASIPLPDVAFSSLAPVVIAMCGELIIGLAFAFGFLVAYVATQLAGRALDVQVGFGAASVLNPATQTVSPLLGNLFGMVAVAFFLSIDGHWVLIRALAASLQAAPPGTLLLAGNWEALLAHSGLMFSFGAVLAGPIMFLLLLADLAMAVVARSMPQLNVFVLGFAIKIVLGLIGLAVSVRFAQAVLNDLFAASFTFWGRLIEN